MREAGVGVRPVTGWRVVAAPQRRGGEREASLEQRALPVDLGKGVAFWCFPQTVDKVILSANFKNTLSHRIKHCNSFDLFHPPVKSNIVCRQVRGWGPERLLGGSVPLSE